VSCFAFFAYFATPNKPPVIEEYLTISELAARLKIKPKSVKNKMAAGIFQKGVHFFSPKGLGPRFKWSAVVAWLEQSQATTNDSDADSIPMPRSYRLKEKTIQS
jgi:hypothetical protein